MGNKAKYIISHIQLNLFMMATIVERFKQESILLPGYRRKVAIVEKVAISGDLTIHTYTTDGL